MPYNKRFQFASTSSNKLNEQQPSDLTRINKLKADGFAGDLNNFQASDLIRAQEFNYIFNALSAELSLIQDEFTRQQNLIETNKNERVRKDDEININVNSNTGKVRTLETWKTNHEAGYINLRDKVNGFLNNFISKQVKIHQDANSAIEFLQSPTNALVKIYLDSQKRNFNIAVKDNASFTDLFNIDLQNKKINIKNNVLSYQNVSTSQISLNEHIPNKEYVDNKINIVQTKLTQLENRQNNINQNTQNELRVGNSHGLIIKGNTNYAEIRRMIPNNTNPGVNVFTFNYDNNNNNIDINGVLKYTSNRTPQNSNELVTKSYVDRMTTNNTIKQESNPALKNLTITGESGQKAKLKLGRYSRYVWEGGDNDLTLKYDGYPAETLLKFDGANFADSKIKKYIDDKFQQLSNRNVPTSIRINKYFTFADDYNISLYPSDSTKDNFRGDSISFQTPTINSNSHITGLIVKIYPNQYNQELNYDYEKTISIYIPKVHNKTGNIDETFSDERNMIYSINGYRMLVNLKIQVKHESQSRKNILTIAAEPIYLFDSTIYQQSNGKIDLNIEIQYEVTTFTLT